MRLLYLASHNQHKLAELQALLAGRCIVKLASEFAPPVRWDESGTSFAENALIKVRAVWARAPAATALGDDSGLEVAALNGRPGVYSARFAGPGASDTDNNAKLVRELKGVGRDRLDARFVCCLAFKCGDREEHVFTGILDGKIVLVPRGDQGFGYDPHFVPAGFPEHDGSLGRERTLAEMSATEKNAMSHRGMAMRLFLTALDEGSVTI